MASPFIPGLELSRQFYIEAVRPILDARFPGLTHSAALMGRGSEVLGFDTEMSTDHDWGPRVSLFLKDDAYARWHEAIEETLGQRLPRQFRGYSTDFGPSIPAHNLTGPGDVVKSGPINHRVDITTLRECFLNTLSFDIDLPLAPVDWLTFPEQSLRAVTAGAVFHDEIGLQAVRDRLAYYQHDIWLYLLAAGWWRINPEENLVGRAGDAGDELGSAIIGSRLVQNLMRLCFLMERQYAPYSKWFGTAFSRLSCAAELSPIFWKALQASTWPERETALAAAYQTVARLHHAMRITDPVPTQPVQLWNRPFKVIWGDFPGILCAQIQDPTVKRIAEQWPTGAIDQCRDILWPARWRPRLLRLFE